MDESLIFGFNLKIARVRQRLTQKQFADKMTDAGIKLSIDAVSKIERGERTVNKDFQRCAATRKRMPLLSAPISNRM